MGSPVNGVLVRPEVHAHTSRVCAKHYFSEGVTIMTHKVFQITHVYLIYLRVIYTQIDAELSAAMSWRSLYVSLELHRN